MARIEKHQSKIVVVEGEEEGDLATAIKFLRPGYGDTLAVSDLSVLGRRREELRDVLNTVLVEKGARIVDGEDRSTDNVPDAINMVLDAMKRKGLPSEQAAENARHSTGNEIDLTRKNDTKDDWLNPAITADKIVETHGISYPTLYRHWVTDRKSAGLEPIFRGRRAGRAPSSS